MPTENSRKENLRSQHLVETNWLGVCLLAGSPGIRVVDMRGYVRTETDASGFQTAEYTGARAEYEKSHIPGAIYIDWTQDIVDENDPVPAQIAPLGKFRRVMEAAGIGDEHLVIAYDSHPASQFATRLWWALRFYGHDNVRVLNGGWEKWKREGRPLASEIPVHPPVTFTPHIRPEMRATAEKVNALLGNSDLCLLDARDEGQYTGRIRRGKRGGHIPGASHLPREALFTSEGTFLSPEGIQQVVDRAGVSPEDHVVAYCNGGVAATSALFALSMLDYPNLTLYDGSWNEWNLREEFPVESE